MSANAMEAMAISAVANADQHAMAVTVKAAANAVLTVSTELELHPADTAVTLAAQDAVMAELSSRRAALTALAMPSLSRRTAAMAIPAMDAPMDPAEEDAELAKARVATDVLTDARDAEVMDAKSAPAKDSSGK